MIFGTIENFCTRSDLLWCSGIRISGGAMLNALKVVLMIENGIFLLRVFIIDIFYANWLPHDAIKGSPFAMLVIFFTPA